jgi:hypothetical protein
MAETLSRDEAATLPTALATEHGGGSSSGAARCARGRCWPGGPRRG